MKHRTNKNNTNGMRPEYNLDYSKAKLNRFANVVKEKVVFYPIDKDIAKVFKNSLHVNQTLRAIIKVVRKKAS